MNETELFLDLDAADRRMTRLFIIWGVTAFITGIIIASIIFSFIGIKSTVEVTHSFIDKAQTSPIPVPQSSASMPVS